VPRGGWRQGAGRKPGQMTKITHVIAKEAFERGVTPLEVMLDNMRFAHEGAESLLEGHPVDLKVLKELLRLRQMSENWRAVPSLSQRKKRRRPC
jgi:hypothetical protein